MKKLLYISILLFVTQISFGQTTVRVAGGGSSSSGSCSCSYSRVTFNTQTSDYTLVLADSSKQILMNDASANTLTVPLNSSVAFPVGTVIKVLQYGAGQTTISPTVGVTIRTAGARFKLYEQYSSATLTKIGTDEWMLDGDLNF